MIWIERESPFRVGRGFLVVAQFPVNRAPAVPRFGELGIFVDHSIQDGQRALELSFLHGFVSLFELAVCMIAGLMKPNVLQRAAAQFARSRLLRMQHTQKLGLALQAGEGHGGVKLLLGICGEELGDEPLLVPCSAMQNGRAADHAEANHNGNEQPAQKPQQRTPHAVTIGPRRRAAIVVSPVSLAGFYLQNIRGQLGQL